MGGIIIAPRIEDFNRLSTEKIREIYREVSLSREELTKILNGL